MNKVRGVTCEGPGGERGQMMVFGSEWPQLASLGLSEADLFGVVLDALPYACDKAGSGNPVRFVSELSTEFEYLLKERLGVYDED